MSVDKNYFTTPVGRLVWGSVEKPKTKDSKGNALVHKYGPDMGKPAQRFEFGIAIPKESETHWNQTTWGKMIYDAAVSAWSAGQYANPLFSWKITDGDSKIPNKKGIPPCTRQGHPGHWILAFSSSFALDILDSTGRNRIEASAIKTGYYIQVAGGVKGSNGNAESPGVYLNAKFISLQAYGPEIVVGPDPTTLGFGQAQLPAGASQTPVASSFVPPVQASVSVPPVPVSAAPTAVTPHTAILSPPPAPPAPAAPVGPQMTAKANGMSYEQFKSAGWTDTALREHGYMV